MKKGRLSEDKLDAICNGIYVFRVKYKEGFTLPGVMVIVLSNHTISEVYGECSVQAAERF